MPALFLAGVLLISAGATAAGIYLLGPDATEKQKHCVEALVDALEPTTKRGVQDIVQQCQARYPA